MSELLDETYDVIIVGAGLSGAIMALELGKAGKSVLVLEAGTGTGGRYFNSVDSDGNEKPDGYQSYKDQFYNAMAKIPTSPYSGNPLVPDPKVTDLRPIPLKDPITEGYFVQKGPMPFSSTYTRAEGGTTLHWLGTCLRMLPDDFKLNTKFGRGLDWPISYSDLEPYYQKAELAIGVSGDAEEQTYNQINNPNVHIPFEKNYDYPMEKIPLSYHDKGMAEGLSGMTVALGEKGTEYPVDVVSTPQGRNSTPRGDYVPVGAVGNPDLGQRCGGNSNCVPICPTQAKFNALKMLEKVRAHENVTIKPQCVVTELEMSDDQKQVTGVHYKYYKSPKSTSGPVFNTYLNNLCPEGVVVLASHAVENAKLLLASGKKGSNGVPFGVANSSGLVGCNLMDHPTMLTWGLMPNSCGSFRGPGSTSGIPSLRSGDFRNDHAAFRIEIGNWGWSWPKGAPVGTVPNLIDQKNLFGEGLRKEIGSVYPRMARFGFLVEQLPEEGNRVTIDKKYLDEMGNYRPIINYQVSDYTRAGMAAAKQVSDQMFQRLGIEGYTEYSPTDPGYLTYEDKGYTFNGAGHLVGTHIMGLEKYPKKSVVNSYQQSHDVPNLYLVGCGSMPTISTSNPTLTMAALAFRTAEHVVKYFD